MSAADEATAAGATTSGDSLREGTARYVGLQQTLHHDRHRRASSRRALAVCVITSFPPVVARDICAVTRHETATYENRP